MELKIALCPLNPIVGDLRGNAQKILAAWVDARQQGADIVMTPEMSLTGYPLEDLTQKPLFLRAAEEMRHWVIDMIRTYETGPALIFGHPTDTGLNDGNRRLVHNSATFATTDIDDGVHLVHKRELPNYGVFDELRNYAPVPHSFVVPWMGLRIGILICEDGWFPNATSSLTAQGADCLLWINGSPFATGKNLQRRKHAENRMRESKVPLAYVNLVGGQDELVFDGDSFAHDGSSYVELPLFRESVQIVNWTIERGQSTKRPATPNMPDTNATSLLEAYLASVLAVRDYTRKQGFRTVVLGMSGGIDSAAAASICVDALGPENVHLVRLPSSFSSEGSLTDAEEAQRLLGCPMRTIAIEPVVDALRKAYEVQRIDIGPEPLRQVTQADRDHTAEHEMKLLTDEFKDAFRRGERDDDPRTIRWMKTLKPKLTGVADENIQARARGNILMAISNQEGHMLITTGNKSEVAVGYATLYGDMCGGYNVLKDLYKTEISAAAGRNARTREEVDAICEKSDPGIVQWRNLLPAEAIRNLGLLGPKGPTVPLSIIVKAESAELAEGQKDSDSLPAYPVLDGILRLLVDMGAGVEGAIDTQTIDFDQDVVDRIVRDGTSAWTGERPMGFARADVERVNGLVNRAEYKRRQGAPGPKIGGMLFGRDRRVPIVNGWKG